SVAEAGRIGRPDTLRAADSEELRGILDAWPGERDVVESGAARVLQIHRRTRVGLEDAQLHVAQLEVLDVSREHAPGGDDSEKFRIWIRRPKLRHLAARLLGSAAAAVVDLQVRERDVLDAVARQARDENPVIGRDVPRDEVLYQD